MYVHILCLCINYISHTNTWTQYSFSYRTKSLFGLPIEEVYEGVHNGHVLGEGVAGVVRLITHRETGIKRAVKRLDCKDLTDEHVNRLLDEIKIMVRPSFVIAMIIIIIIIVCIHNLMIILFSSVFS